MKKIKNKINSLLLVSALTIIGIFSESPVFAADSSDISTVTDSVTTAISSSKSDLVAAIGAVVAVGVGWFLVKYVVIQVISYFKKVASK